MEYDCKTMAWLRRKLVKDDKGCIVASRHHALLAVRLAYEEGMLNVIKNLPDLKWDYYKGYTQVPDMQRRVASCHTMYGVMYMEIDTIGRYWLYTEDYGHVNTGTKALREAEKFANVYYKQKIKLRFGF